MLELNALRMAVQEWENADTEDDKAWARAKVKELITPGLARIILARIDDLESRFPE